MRDAPRNVRFRNRRTAEWLPLPDMAGDRTGGKSGLSMAFTHHGAGEVRGDVVTSEGKPSRK